MQTNKTINDFKPGEIYSHPQLKQVKILRREEGSRTKLIVECVDRGKGFHEKTGTFKGFKNSVGWMRGENREFGSEHVVHKNTLKNLPVQIIEQ